ncbi:MAG: hypothetical protein HC809_11510 [Gammaproteobacteria bacterium]|nr:hypothetical protein [Gammaproteobacteria bacterium]
MLTFRNALIFDGSGQPPVHGDLAIDGSRVVAPSPSSGTDMDATGLAIAPGFIDVHTHDDFAAVLHADMAFKVRGGVTTCIVGNCGDGSSAVPGGSATGPRVSSARDAARLGRLSRLLCASRPPRPQREHRRARGPRYAANGGDEA